MIEESESDSTTEEELNDPREEEAAASGSVPSNLDLEKSINCPSSRKERVTTSFVNHNANTNLEARTLAKLAGIVAKVTDAKMKWAFPHQFGDAIIQYEVALEESFKSRVKTACGHGKHRRNSKRYSELPKVIGSWNLLEWIDG